MGHRLSKIIVFLGFLGVGCFFPLRVCGETVILKSGKKISGKIIRDNEDGVLIELSSGIQIAIKKEQLPETAVPDEASGEPAEKQSEASRGVDDAMPRIIDARTQEDAEQEDFSLEDRKQIIVFLNQTSFIDGKLKEILNQKKMRYQQADKEDGNDEEEKDIINKRIQVIEEAIGKLRDVHPPEGGRDFYEVLNKFYESMRKTEMAMLEAVGFREPSEQGKESIRNTVRLAEEADKVLNNLLNTYRIVDVKHQEEKKEIKVEADKSYKEKKKAYDAQVAEIRENQIKHQRMQQRRDFLRYLNY